MPSKKKTPEMRHREVAVLNEKLATLGIPEADLSDIHKALADFGHHGISYSCRKYLRHLGVCVICILSNQAHIDSHIVLQRIKTAEARR